MKKIKLVSFLLIVLVLTFTVSCSSKTSSQKSEEEIRAEIKAEMEKEVENKANIRTDLTNEQIETIANNLVASFNLFNEENLSIDANGAESFVYYLVFKNNEQHIIDNYISDMGKLGPSNLSEIKDGTVDGKYIKALAKAIFGIDINPKNQYTDQPYDPALVESELKEVSKENGKFIATLDILDVMEQPYLTMEMHLSLTDEGYTRVEYVSTKEINNSSESSNLIEVSSLKVGSTFNGGTIKTIDYKPNDSILIELEGELTLKGYFYYDDMYGDIHFSFEESELPTKIKLDNDYILSPSKFGIYITNQDLLKNKLGNNEIEKMMNEWDYKIPAVIKINNYGLGAKFESEGDSSAKLLEIIEMDIESKPIAKNETFRDTYIDYENSKIVAIEAYDGINTHILDTKECTTEAYEEYPTSWNVAIFGTAYKIRVESTASMEAETKLTYLADQLTDTKIQFTTNFPTDFSVDVLIFEDDNGNEYSVILEDMSDMMDIVQVKK